MRTRRRATINDLRLAIDCLPVATKIAMLEGIRSNEIIVGAYSDRGGICPMLAAHRAGGRTSFVSFARAWDAFAFRDARLKRARRATERELLILTTHLEASLLAQDASATDLATALAEHRELLGRRHVTADTRPGHRDRFAELERRPGWTWMRAVRRYDDYQRALARLDSERDALECELIS